MIDKITPRGLDKSSDHKLVSKAGMIDAVNLYIADDYVNEEGNAGVLKSVRGNIEVQYATEEDRPLYPLANTKVIGSVTDSKTKAANATTSVVTGDVSFSESSMYSSGTRISILDSLTIILPSLKIKCIFCMTTCNFTSRISCTNRKHIISISIFY